MLNSFFTQVWIKLSQVVRFTGVLASIILFFCFSTFSIVGFAASGLKAHESCNAIHQINHLIHHSNPYSDLPKAVETSPEFLEELEDASDSSDDAVSAMPAYNGWINHFKTKLSKQAIKANFAPLNTKSIPLFVLFHSWKGFIS